MGAFLDYIVYLALRGAWALARMLPLRTVRGALGWLAGAVFVVDRHHRRVALDNMRLAFPEWSDRECVRAARLAFHNWARIAAELAHAEEISRGKTRDTIGELERKAAELGAGGRGVLALTAHTANFELLAWLLGRASGKRVVLFHRRMANRFVEAFLIGHREAMNVTTLGRGIVVREALRVLARGDILVVPLDQNQSARRGIFVEFFGRAACTSTMLARLSIATGLSVQPAFAVWEGEELTAVLGEAIAPPREAQSDRPGAVRELTQLYTHEVERVIRRYPTQWNWAHRRWKTRPALSPASAEARRTATTAADPCDLKQPSPERPSA